MEFNAPQVSDSYSGNNRIVTVTMRTHDSEIWLRVSFHNEPKIGSETSDQEDARFVQRAKEALRLAADSL